MLLKNDNELRSFDQRFLGPKGMTLYWEARYAAYPVWAGIMVVLIILEHKIGIGANATTIVATIAAAVGATTEIMRRVDAERPVRAVFQNFWCELGTPRPERPYAERVQVRRIKRKAMS